MERHNRFATLFCVIFLLGLASPVWAGNLVQRVFDARDGLNNATINDISFDEHGYAWLSTEQGLYRLSDTTARRIDKNSKDIRLSDEFIWLSRPLNEKYLLVSSGANTYLYDQFNDEFIRFGSSELFTDFKADGFFEVIEQADGSYLLLTYSGALYRFDDKAMSLRAIIQLPSNPDQRWFLLAQNEMDQLIVGNGHELQLRDSLGMLRAVFPWDESMGLMRSLFKDSAGRIWLGSSKGLYRVFPDSMTVQRVEQLPFYVSHMDEDHEGFLWLSGRESVIKWHPDTAQLKVFFDELKAAADLDYVYDIAVDHNGLIWVGGSGDGLAVLADAPDFVLENFTSQPPYRLDGEMVWTIHGDEEGHWLWLGTDKGLIEIDRQKKTSQLVRPAQLEVNDSIYIVRPLDDKHLLVGTTNGLFVYRLDDKSIVPFAQWTGGEYSLESKVLYALYQDTLLPQRWWFVTATGLFYWDKGSKNPQEFIIKDRDGAQYNRPLKTIFRASDGKLWLGGESEFGYIDTQGVFYSRRDIFFDDKTVVSVSYINEVTPGLLWLGTSPKGLVEYNTQTGVTRMLTQEWQLDCNAVYFIQSTPNYRLIGCSNSLVRQEIETGQLSVFRQQDGLVSNELNDGAAFYAPEVGFYVGSPDGVDLLDLDLLKNRLQETEVMLESVQTYFDDEISTDLLPLQNKRIPPGAKMLSFQLTRTDYLTNSPIKFKYRLYKKGANKGNYLQLNGQSQINMTGISAGDYILEVISKRNGIWLETPFSYAFSIEEFWWNSTWFKTLALVLLISSGLSFFILRQRQIKAFRQINQALTESKSRLRQSLRGSDSELWEWHSDTQLFSMEPHAYEHLLVKDLSEISFESLPIHQEDRDRIVLAWQRLLNKQDDRFDEDYRYWRKDGAMGWLRVRGRPVEMDPATGEINKVSGIYTDITSRRRLEDNVKLLAQAFENTSEGVLILDGEEKVKVFNKAAQTILNIGADGLIDRDFSVLVHGTEERSNEVQQLLDQESSWTGEHDFYASNGELRPVWLNLSTMKDKGGQVSHYVAVFSDISQRKQTEADLRRLANFDVLTGLPNRSLFSARLDKAIAQAQSQNQQLALLFLDLDRFKNVNDSFGHSMGDGILIEAANRLQTCVGEEHILCRFGGDEFVILLRNMNDIDEINHLCETLLEQIERPFELNGREFYLSTSIGVSLWPDDALRPEALIKNADQAMYYAKEIGRGNFQYFSAERNVTALYHLKLERDLRKAIERNELELNFQPQIDVADGNKVLGVEALLRWLHPKEGYIPPDVFIKIAESSGLILDIDRWVLGQVCQLGAKWGERLGDGFRISVNVSAVQFRQPDFIQGISRVLAESGMSPHRLGLEITEGVLMKELRVAREHLKALKQLGIDVAIDDFGTGYSSLAYLRNFDVGLLKIDRAFIIDIANNEADQAIVSSISELARNLKLSVVVEGVETQEQLEQVLGRGCHIIQGYYFAKPMTVSALEAFVFGETSLLSSNRVS
ncbi:EAL domain-containing protein [Shewanella sp. AS1]|uniref:EAL domain-containing protein n=1 Tax=Shewanella sp. AS1 TaxID=2907626 RepID=UPI001F3A8E01|nr:EAL domain-containing protein [Shewanella sp. AS1]MCE9679896.1 EAL domain-containing protein [Shewanella sp. AS1]